MSSSRTPPVQPVEAGALPRFAVREDRLSKTTPSLASYYENREVEEWIQSVAGVLDQGWNDQCAFILFYLSTPSTFSSLLRRPCISN